MKRPSAVALIVCTAVLLAPALAVDAADPWRHAQPLTVVMLDNRFEPPHVMFQHGKAYELRLENHGKDLHEFTAPDFFRAATLRDKRQLANGGIEVVVQPGRTARIFLLAPVKGEYRLTCADHDWDGMVGSITVN